MAAHASHVFSQHLGADCGAAVLAVETTNTSGSPTDDSEYRWNLAPMFARGAARQLKAGKMKFPEVEAMLESLQREYFPFKVEGDCLYGANRTENGWWLWVFNNKGVTKFTDAPHTVDHSFDAVVSVSCGKVGVASIRELITERDVPAAAGAFTHRVAAGDLAVFEIAAAK